MTVICASCRSAADSRAIALVWGGPCTSVIRNRAGRCPAGAAGAGDELAPHAPSETRRHIVAGPVGGATAPVAGSNRADSAVIAVSR